MSLSTTERDVIDNSNPDAQKVSLGTEVYNNQVNITAILGGKGITLPTSDPGVAGELWADTLVVKVSAGS